MTKNILYRKRIFVFCGGFFIVRICLEPGFLQDLQNYQDTNKTLSSKSFFWTQMTQKSQI